MRTSLLALRAAGAVAVLAAGPVLCPGVARAGDAGASVRITVSPAAVAPGGELRIRVEGCERSPATAGSHAFVTEAVLSGLDEGRGVPLSGETTIRSSASPGLYEVRVGCDGRALAGSAVLRVGAPDGAGFPPVPQPATTAATAGPTTAATAVPTVAASAVPTASPGSTGQGPVGRPGPAARSAPFSVLLRASGGPDGAGGDKAPNTVGDGHKGTAQSGPGIPQTVIGLVLAGIAAVAVALRSVRRQRGVTKDTD